MHTLRSLAPLALALPLAVGGCYRYDMRATNASSQDVRISLVKGKRQREISTVVLEPGASVGWSGTSQRPLLLRVSTDPDVGDRTDVVVPRKVHTEFEVLSEGGQLTVASDQPVTLVEPAQSEAEASPADGQPAAQEPARQPAQTGAAQPETDDDQPAVDLIEDDD
jgi:hypothetical protein